MPGLPVGSRMVPTRRRFLLALAGTAAAVGCLADGDDALPGRNGTDRPAESTSTSETTSERSWWEDAERTADVDHSVTLTNVGSEPRTVRVRAYRTSSGDVVYDETFDLDAGDGRGEIFNTLDVYAPGNVAYRVLATMGEQSEESTFETDACHGGARVRIAEGELRISSAIC